MTRLFAVVGNGPLSDKARHAIGGADYIIRFNDCRSDPEGRTDAVAVCNTGRPARAMTREPAWIEIPAVAQAAELWCVREALVFSAMRDSILSRHPELSDFFDDHTESYRAIASARQKQLHVISGRTYDWLEKQLKQHGDGYYIAPSSGALVIAELLHRMSEQDCILLAGFSHQGWEFHPWAAEKRWVDALAAQQGVLRRIGYAAG